jgi:hypothetical protein
VAANGAEGWLVSPDGSWQRLPEPDRARTVRPGDVLVDTEAGSRFYSTTDHRWADVAASQPAAAAGYVTPDGHLVSCATDAEGQPFAFRSGEHPARRLDVGETRGALTCALAGSANYVTAEILGDVADGGIPLRAVLTSRDGGATWERASDLPYGISANSMAVTSGGATVLAFDDGRLHVVRPGRPTDVAPDTYGTVFGGGSRVYALSYALSKGPLLYSDDDGATWQETVLPGMESSKD